MRVGCVSITTVAQFCCLDIVFFDVNKVFHLSKLFLCLRGRSPLSALSIEKKWIVKVYLVLYVVYLRCFDSIGVLWVKVIWHLLIGFAPIEYVRDAWSYTYLSVNFTKT